MDQRELQLLRDTTALRVQLLESLSDADLAFALPGNPTFGVLIRDMGETEGAYIEAFKTLKHVWGIRPAEAGIETSVARLQAWFTGLDQELEAALTSIPEADFWTKQVDRGGGFLLPLGAAFHTYREAALIFYGKCVVYLHALDRPLNEQWQGWVG
jgi:hypothetical protein